jgi:hypothetical protein
MSGVFALGIITTLMLEALGYVIYRGWRKAFPTGPLQPPITEAQQANARSYDRMVVSRGQVRSARIQRRTRRGPRRLQVEDNPFED